MPILEHQRQPIQRISRAELKCGIEMRQGSSHLAGTIPVGLAKAVMGEGVVRVD